ncbi:alpha,alpha-trehalase TreF [Sphingosinithalassobacter sp. LHW66-3]|uniref:alpha,alpha-trehalase TreF n=1 Tax=Sphingosinithalassobacter sp. LHW66-3 TaxID=3424718 RepID=UPI003D6A4CF7
MAAFLAASLPAACAGPQTPLALVATTADTASVATPADLYGDLFVQVQMRRIFPDGKTFVDAVPRREPAAILAAWRERDFAGDDAALRRFVLDNFDLPAADAQPTPSLVRRGPALPLESHIGALWAHLTKPPVVSERGSSALALPEPFVVPGGRFRELYYWDSYFTMLGLARDGRDDLIESMLADFTSLVDRFGHVPNGTRTYYVSRSQPPFLYLMAELSAEQDRAVLEARLAALRAEHDFWMRGADRLGDSVPAAARVVRMPDGALLNRYWDDRDTPRDESYREDVETAAESGRPSAEVYRHLRAGAESGWDFSSRWLADGRTLASIDTTNIVPVDLNSLLYGLESAIAERCWTLGDTACGDRYARAAEARRVAIERWLWSEGEGRYGDWDIARGGIRPGVTAATLYPLFTGVIEGGPRADAVAAAVEASLLAPGGLRTTTVDTGQQWDAPNGWPPLQWIAVEGLRRTGHPELARAVADRFLGTVVRTYRETGKLVEKYDVEAVRPGGGGEYPLQDGFGWTNGVTRALMAEYGLPGE